MYCNTKLIIKVSYIWYRDFKRYFSLSHFDIIYIYFFVGSFEIRLLLSTDFIYIVVAHKFYN